MYAEEAKEARLAGNARGGKSTIEIQLTSPVHTAELAAEALNVSPPLVYRAGRVEERWHGRSVRRLSDDPLKKSPERLNAPSV